MKTMNSAPVKGEIADVSFFALSCVRIQRESSLGPQLSTLVLLTSAIAIYLSSFAFAVYLSSFQSSFFSKFSLQQLIERVRPSDLNCSAGIRIGGGGGGGGGSGGQGGIVWIVCHKLTNSGTISANGGTGGTGGTHGNGQGTGTNGTDGANGAAGLAGIVIQLIE